MNTYIKKPSYIKRSQFSNKNFCKNSLCPKDYRELITKNENTVNFNDFIIKKYRGKEIGSDAYMKQSKYKFLKTTNISSNFCLSDEKSEYCKPINLIFPKKNDLLIVKDGAGNGLGEVCIYNKENNDNFDTISSGILGAKINQDYLYYVTSFIKSQHFKDYININTAQGSTIRHSKEIAFEYSIPFPTIKNHKNKQNIEKLISILTKNLIDKEEQIKNKNKSIDEKIDKELEENQKIDKFEYNYPNISNIKKEKRLDTGLYTNKYKQYEYKITNYNNGCYFLSKDNISPGKTPPDYHFSSIKRNNNFYNWVTPKNIENRQLFYHTYIYTKTQTKVKNYSLILNGIRYVGNGIFIDENQTFFTNQNTLIINQFKDKQKQLFLFCFLTSKIGKDMQMTRRNFGIVPILYTNSLCKIPIPKFSINKQNEISKLYYNNIDTVNNIILSNYFEENQIRNKSLGIFQLNKEIFELKTKLEILINKVTMNKSITIEDYLTDNKS